MRTLKPRATGGTSRPSRQADAQQQRDFAAAAEQTSQPELHQQLNRLKVIPASASKLALVRAMIKPVARRLAVAGAIALGTLYIWLLLFSLIQGSSWLVENVFAKAVLMVLLAVLTLGGVVWLISRLDQKLRRQVDPTAQMLAERAERIARLTGVRLVLMGHTHLVDIRRVADGQAVYANSGTWVAVDNPWQRIEPAARRCTLLWVQGDEVEVCRWNDDAGRLDPVPMFDRPPLEQTEDKPPLV
jgi:hypothetical protein